MIRWRSNVRAVIGWWGHVWDWTIMGWFLKEFGGVLLILLPKWLFILLICPIYSSHNCMALFDRTQRQHDNHFCFQSCILYVYVKSASQKFRLGSDTIANWNIQQSEHKCDSKHLFLSFFLIFYIFHDRHLVVGLDLILWHAAGLAILCMNIFVWNFVVGECFIGSALTSITDLKLLAKKYISRHATLVMSNRSQLWHVQYHSTASVVIKDSLPCSTFSFYLQSSGNHIVILKCGEIPGWHILMDH